MNQGAWYQISIICSPASPTKHSLHYAGRVRSPSPACGHLATHIAEQASSSSRRSSAPPGSDHAAE